MAGLAEGLKMLKNRAVSEPPTFKPEFLLQGKERAQFKFKRLNFIVNFIKLICSGSDLYSGSDLFLQPRF
ncbi:hypothetical protein Tco_0944256 [Tanacetum coccineum]